MSCLMTKRQTSAQKEMIEHLESTYLMRDKVSGYNLAITQKPSIFRQNTKKERHFNKCVNHAKADFKELRFFFDYLKPMYRMRILNSNEFNNFLEKILNPHSSFNLQTKEEQDRSLKIALQMYEFARVVIKENMPEEFQTVLEESSRPFWQMIKAIDAYQKREKIKDSPDIQIRYIDTLSSNLSAFSS